MTTPGRRLADLAGLFRRQTVVRWWQRRTLHARVSVLVTGAVATAVLALAALAFAAVGQTLNRQIESDLRTDASAIAAQPEQWRVAPGHLPDPNGAGRPGPEGRRRLRDLGPLWQIIDADGGVVSQATSVLPVTAAARRVADGRRRSVQETVTIGDRSYLMLTTSTSGGGAVQVAVDQTPTRRTLAVFGLLLAAGCCAVIAVAAVLGRMVARSGLTPVQRLTDAVEEVAATMDLDHPVPVQGVDEIARLGRSVNTLLGAIGTARQAQRALVEDAGHELRTPLTSIRTNIELLLSVERQPELAHRLPPHERAQLLRELDAQVAELATLTTELVELAREEAAREDPEPADLTEIVTAAIGRVQIRAAGITFTTDLQPVMVYGRPGELERMVVNVLDNAAKWSPPAATVHTELCADGDWCRLTVTDSGPGIDDADRPHVFDRFYRSAAARGMPGSGLGLAIVAQTAAQHGGTVAADPNTPHGTVITIRLPCRVAGDP